MQSNVAMLSTWYWQSHLHVQLQGITGKDNQTMAMGIRIVFTSTCANFVTQSFMVIDWSRFFKIRMVLATTCAPLSLTLGSNAARGTTVRMLMMARQLWLRCLDLGGVGWEFYEVKLRWRWNNIIVTITIISIISSSGGDGTTSGGGGGDYDLADVLGKSILFYEAQRSGYYRVCWRYCWCYNIDVHRYDGYLIVVKILLML